MCVCECEDRWAACGMIFGFRRRIFSSNYHILYVGIFFSYGQPHIVHHHPPKVGCNAVFLCLSDLILHILRPW